MKWKLLELIVAMEGREMTHPRSLSIAWYWYSKINMYFFVFVVTSWACDNDDDYSDDGSDADSDHDSDDDDDDCDDHKVKGERDDDLERREHSTRISSKL